MPIKVIKKAPTEGFTDWFTVFSIFLHSSGFSDAETLVPFSPDSLSANTRLPLSSDSMSITEEWQNIFIDLCLSAYALAWTLMAFTRNYLRQDGQTISKIFYLEGGASNA